MGINPRNLKELIIEPTLKEMGDKFYSDSAVNLLLMTCATESQCGTHLKQGLNKLDDGEARARGIYQMEPATHDDTWKRFPWSRSNYSKTILMPQINKNRLIYDLKYATIMARAKYWLAPKAIPNAEDINALSIIFEMTSSP